MCTGRGKGCGSWIRSFLELASEHYEEPHAELFKKCHFSNKYKFLRKSWKLSYSNKSMSDVFISYPHEAEADASRLAATLQQKGLSAWTAGDNLSNNSGNWKAEIENALKSAVAIVFLVYPSREPSAWLQHEYMNALESYWSGSAKILVPVLIGKNVEPPSFLRQWESLKVHDKSDWDRTASQLASWIETDQYVRNKPSKKDQAEFNRRLNEIAQVAKRWQSNSESSRVTESGTGDKIVYRSSRTGEFSHGGKKKSRTTGKKK